MTAAARIFIPENTLARHIDAPGAATFGELVLDAARRVEAMEPAVNAYVEERSLALLASIGGLPPATREGRLALALEAGSLAEVAGLNRADAIGHIAKGIALLVRQLNDQDVWRADLVHVHAATLALATGRRTVPDFAAMLSGLRHARATIGILE